MTIGSLFSGIGGLELGLEWAGLGPVLWQVEKDEKCRNCLATHWPEAKRYEDVCTVGKNELEPVDLICGGFPCQDVSSAGKRAGLAGARSGLWFEFARIIGELRPQCVVVENVGSGAEKWVDAVRRSLEQFGYASLPVPLAASDVGAWHRRERIFIVAYACSFGKRESDTDTDTDTDTIRHCEQAREASFSGSSLSPYPNGDLLRLKRWGGARSSGQEAGELETGTSDSDDSRELREAAGRQQGRHWTCDEHIWTAEPDVARMVHGLSGELEFISDIIKQINNPKKNTAARIVVWKMLRAMWEYRELAAASPDLYRERLHYCVPEMSHRGAHGRWFMGAWQKETEAVRRMWERVHAEPFEETQDMQQTLFEHLRETQRKQTMARKGRTDRERALGNSVVPQCAEVIGHVVRLLNGM